MNTIILNASSSTLNSATQNAFYVNPIRVDNTTSTSLIQYNSSTKEITYNSSLSVQPNSWIRFALTGNQTAQGAITFNNNTIYGSTVDFSYTGSTLTILTTGYYKVEACCTFINTAAEKEIYLNFFQLTPSASILCFSVGSCGIEDAGTTYNNVSISDMLLLTAGITYNFSFSSQTGTSSDLYAYSRALITRVT